MEVLNICVCVCGGLFTHYHSTDFLHGSKVLIWWRRRQFETKTVEGSS